MSSDDYNDMIDELSHDLAEFNTQWNNRLIPLTTTIPDGTDDSSVDAFTNGLSGRHLYTDATATAASNVAYYNSSSARPYTILEQFTDVYNEIRSVQNSLEGDIADITPSAEQVAIADSGGLFTASNVEDALSEVRIALSSLETTFGSSGNVAKNGTAADNQVAVWLSDGVLEGNSNFTWDGSILTLAGSISLTGTVDGVDVSDHSSRHEQGGSDALNVELLANNSLAADRTIKSDGSGGWTVIDAPDVYISGTPSANQVTVWASATEIEGSSNFVWENDDKQLQAGLVSNLTGIDTIPSLVVGGENSIGPGVLIVSTYSSTADVTLLELYHKDTVKTRQRIEFTSDHDSTRTLRGMIRVDYNSIEDDGLSHAGSRLQINTVSDNSGTINYSHLLLDENANVAIGANVTSSCASKLDVVGNTTIGSTYALNNAAPADGLIVEGNVAIGVTSTSEALTVNGAVKIGNASATGDGTIRWDGSDFEGRKSGSWVSLTAQPISNLNELSDVSGTPSDNDVLTYITASGWIPLSAGSSHTIASHSDTTATGAELETLTDGSNADALHSHVLASHASSHENGGGDEISVSGLSGTLADPQTPTSHASDHQSGGGDAIKLDDLATPDDNTDLDATTSIHGLLPKLGGGTSNFLRADGSWAAPTVSAAGSDTEVQFNSGGSLAGDIPFRYDSGRVLIGGISEFFESLAISDTGTGAADPSISIKERSSAPTNRATYLTIWVKNTTPASLWFTDDVAGNYEVASVYSLVSKTANYTAVIGEVVLCDPSGGGFTITLPTAADVSGKTIVVKNTTTSTNTITVDTTSSQTMDGETSLTINEAYKSLTFISDGSNWSII
jgi:hypothetical protein